MTDIQKNAEILIVEDEIIIADDLEFRLESLGYTICGKTASGAEALDIVERRRPDLVILDIVLKGKMDGIEAAELIRNKYEIPILFLTAYADVDRLERARLTNPFGYLLKPFNDRDLSVTVEMALYAAKADAERKKAEERSRIFFEKSRDAIFIVSEESQFVEVNEAAVRLTGYDRDELLCMSIPDLHDDVDLQAYRDFFEIIMNGEPVTSEAKIRRKDGSKVDVEFSNTMVVIDNIRYMHTIARDVSERKQAVGNILYSEKLYREIAKQSGEGLSLADSEGDYRMVNPAFCKMTGYGESELLSMNVRDVIPRDSKLDLFQRVAGGESGLRESELVRKDGSRFLAEVSGYPVELDNQRFILGIVRDITERKQAENIQAARLRLVEYGGRHSTTELLQKFLDEIEAFTDSEIGFFHFYDEDKELLTYQTWSTNTLKNMCSARGAGPHYPLSKAGVWGDCIHERAPVIHNDYASLPHRKGMPDGHAAVIRELIVPVFRQDEIKAVLGVGNKKTNYRESDVMAVSSLADLAWDVVERKQAEEALRISEERFKLASEGTEDGLWDWDLTTNDAFHSDQFALMLGYQPHELPYTSDAWSDLIHPEDKESAFEKVEAYLNRKTDRYESTFRMKAKDGSYRWILGRGKCLFDNDGKPVRFVGFNTDITGRKKEEEERKLLQSQLQQAQKMEAVGTLAGGIAHDFNNLLHAINGYSQILLMNKPETDPDYPSLQAIMNSGNRAAELVRQLLLFSRKVEAERRPVNLNHEVKQAQKILERTIPKMVEIEFKPGEKLWTVNADPIQMEQIILNLGKNAADAMPNGGRLLIETENIALTDGYVETHFGVTAGDYVLLTVCDTGCGMDSETMAHIFEPFFTTKQIGKGTGLGLASVYGIVKSHGGHITCYSEVGQGTCFKIYMPAIERMDKAAVKREKKITPRGGTETILLVDDEEPIRDFTSRALKQFGYAVLTASTGEEALERYKNNLNSVDLIIMDIGMPGMGGHQCLREILRLNSSAKIIVATGYSLNGKVKETMDAGALGYVGKPYRVFDLLSKVRTILDE